MIPIPVHGDAQRPTQRRSARRRPAAPSTATCSRCCGNARRGAPWRAQRMARARRTARAPSACSSVEAAARTTHATRSAPGSDRRGMVLGQGLIFPGRHRVITFVPGKICQRVCYNIGACQKWAILPGTNILADHLLESIRDHFVPGKRFCSKTNPRKLQGFERHMLSRGGAVAMPRQRRRPARRRPARRGRVDAARCTPTITHMACAERVALRSSRRAACAERACRAPSACRALCAPRWPPPRVAAACAACCRTGCRWSMPC